MVIYVKHFLFRKFYGYCNSNFLKVKKDCKVKVPLQISISSISFHIIM